VLCNDRSTLVWATNLGDIEKHVLLAQAPKLDRPTSIVFDLDPGEPAGILDCAHVALGLQKVFDGLGLESFVKKSDIEQIYLDTPYYLTPSDKVSLEAFSVIRDALAEKKMAGLARIVLYRRERPVVIEALGKGMLLTTLRYDHTVRQPETVFDEIAKVSVDQEMTDLATHIIDKKKGKFDPSKFDDRYEDALLALINSKQAGKKPPIVSAAEPPSNVVNLFDALRKSLASEGGSPKPAAKGKSPAAREKTLKKASASRKR
jgi:DNA end-binding protein Ku